MRLPAPPLLLITDGRQARLPLETILDAAFDAGCVWASVREKHLPAHEQIALARRLHSVSKAHAAVLTLHGEPELAAEARLDGVHLSAGSDARKARALLGPDALIGISVHGAAELGKVAAEALDYAIAGPVFLTPSKPGYGPALQPQGLVDCVRASPVPVLGIGGISAENVSAVMQTDTAGVAVMGEVMRAHDPKSTMRHLLAELREAAQVNLR